ncbi:acyl-CoA thioesterase [Robiginitalea aurantiaca]|uniref:Thioesterase family protein n=1 Tax=Robiginitalea aurantiaca TaxID=3056915 RepID=A0ABT7WG73_9FLAO|nr:thioesterase family protein [Robiginitalea aurantiaca]MDM9631920.1 thioesterase family protein [Robiginitalea aurantiaca]
MNTFHINVTVAPEHLDDLNHVNNVQYLEWVQQVSKAHWQKLSLPEWDMHYIWVVHSHLIRYHQPAFLGEELVISTFIKAAKGAKSERHVHITRKGMEPPLVTCETIWVLLDAKSGKPVRVPAEMISALE